MSYDLALVDPVTQEILNLDAPHHMRGGTYCLGGCPDAAINITYNYGQHFLRVFGDTGTELSEHDKMFGGGQTGIRKLYGLTGAESIPVLKSAIEKLGDDVDDDYWKPTEGNAKRALMQCLALAQMRPDGVWQGD